MDITSIHHPENCSSCPLDTVDANTPRCNHDSLAFSPELLLRLPDRPVLFPSLRASGKNDEIVLLHNDSIPFIDLPIRKRHDIADAKIFLC